MAARWISYQRDSEHKFARTPPCHNVQKSTSYYFVGPTHMSAEVVGGIQICCIGNHLKLMGYYPLAKKHEAPLMAGCSVCYRPRSITQELRRRRHPALEALRVVVLLHPGVVGLRAVG